MAIFWIIAQCSLVNYTAQQPARPRSSKKEEEEEKELDSAARISVSVRR